MAELCTPPVNYYQKTKQITASTMPETLCLWINLDGYASIGVFFDNADELTRAAEGINNLHIHPTAAPHGAEGAARPMPTASTTDEEIPF
jgi:hypothetical protein